MSFSSEIKLGFLSSPGKGRCCRRAFASGILASSFSLGSGSACFRTTDRELAEGIAEAIGSVFGGAPAELGREGRLHYTVCTREKLPISFLSALREDENAPLFYPKCKGCRIAYLRGVFVGAGRVSDPGSAYHLEFSLPERFHRLSAQFADFGILLTEGRRRDEHLLYTKSSSAIQDFFGMLEENDAYFSLMNARIEREIRNGANRVANCEANNITKAVNAAQNQLSAIEYLAEAQLLESLPIELADTARLRLAHPELSLAQLALESVPPISKPGLSHRLRRLVAIADEHRAASKEKEES